MAAEISATSSAWPVLKLAPGNAIGNTSTIIASGKRAIIPFDTNKFIYCVALVPPAVKRS